MKLAKYILILLSLVLLLSVVSFAQDEDMTCEEWEGEMARLGQEKTSLMNEISALKTDIDNLTAQKSGIQDYDECIDELYALVGATGEDVENFADAVNELDGMVRREESPKKDRQADLDALNRLEYIFLATPAAHAAPCEA